MRMTTQLTAVFDDRDGADLALMRLRRNGIEFELKDLRAPDKKPENDMPLLGLGPALRAGQPTDSVLPGQMYAAVLGSRAALERSAAAAGQAKLTVNVRTDQVLKAREIIATVKGRVI